MAVSIRIEGAQEAIRELLLLDERAQAPARPLLQTLSQLMVGWFRKRIRDSGRDLAGTPYAWAPLHPVTRAIRRRHGHDGKPDLYRRGDMHDSLRELSLGDDFVEVGTNNPWAADVQDGGPTTRGKGRPRDLPPRPFVILTDQQIDDLEELVVDWFTGGDPAGASTGAA